MSFGSSLQLEEQVIGFYVKRVNSSNVGDDLVDEFLAHFDVPLAAGRLDFSIVREWSPITNGELTARPR